MMGDANCLLFLLGLCFLCSGGCGEAPLETDSQWAQAGIGFVFIIVAAFRQDKDE